MTQQEKIAIKRVVFHSMPHFIYSVAEWIKDGGYKGFIKNNRICISEIKEVKNDYMSFEEFNNLNIWEG